MKHEFRSLVIRTNAQAELKTAEFRGATHYVVPVVLMVEGVVHAVNASEPELVLAEEFLKMAKSWDGRPVVPNHPDDGVTQIPANSPTVLAAKQFGYLFNVHVEGKRLVGEAWLSQAMADATGDPVALEVMERVKNKETIEISVGAFIISEQKSGNFGGKWYARIWREIGPDHLAMLSKDKVGACSVEMGCGALRSASAIHIVTEEGIAPMADPAPKKSFKDKLFDLLFKASEGTAEDVSLRETKSAIDASLRASVPGYMGIIDVYPTEGLVIYETMPADKWLIYRRSYSINDKKEITLSDDSQEVIPKTTFEAAETAPKKAPCGCHNKGEVDMKKAERIAALIASKKNDLTEADQAWLEQVPEERLAALEASATTPAPSEEQVAAAIKAAEQKKIDEKKAADLVAAAAKPQDEKTWLESAPASVRALVTRAQAQEKAQKDGLIGKLITAQKVYSQDELSGMELEQLERLAKLVKVDEQVDASLSGGRMRVAAQNDDDAVPAPPDSLGGFERKSA
jgi:hypothetical protein